MIFNKELISNIAQNNNITMVGVIPKEALLKIRTNIKYLKEWQLLDFAADMQYMKKNADQFLEVADWVKSVVILGFNYPALSTPAIVPKGFGRVARYALGRDYHKVIPSISKKIVEELEKTTDKKIQYRATTDALPFLERAVANLSGLGEIGKNSMLIQKAVGSFFLIGEIFLDIEIEDNDPGIFIQKTPGTICKSCVTCITRCPTQAIVKEGVIDAKKCISYLTIEKRGVFSRWEESAIGSWLFGCDICQEVCPFNAVEIKTKKQQTHPDFNSRYKEGLISLKQILSIKSDEEYLKQFAGTPIMRAKREGLIRNALCVAKNTNSVQLFKDEIITLLSDNNRIIKETAEQILS